MIKQIFELLEYANGDTELIKTAQGKYHLPESFKDTFKKIKKETQWQRSTQ